MVEVQALDIKGKAQEGATKVFEKAAVAGSVIGDVLEVW